MRRARVIKGLRIVGEGMCGWGNLPDLYNSGVFTKIFQSRDSFAFQ
jgi:hypothetical protein